MSSRIRFLLPIFPAPPVPAGRIIYIPHQMLNVLKYIALIGTFFIYTTSGVFSKLASQREILSPGYIAFLGCTVGVLGIYAVLWQQIIKRMDVSLAYMFKGSGVVFGLMLAHFVFGEAITTTNTSGRQSSSAALRCMRGPCSQNKPAI